MKRHQPHNYYGSAAKQRRSNREKPRTGTYGLAEQGAGPGNAGAQKTKTYGSSGTMNMEIDKLKETKEKRKKRKLSQMKP
ncbi:MAG: hypothetical protein ABSF65_01595 [Candidatus Bathyarchaeia archaeon]